MFGERLRDLRAKEAARARRALPAEEPIPGQVWAISPSISTADGLALLEHSRTPLSVIVHRAVGTLFQVIPISFETEMAGAFDIPLSDKILGRPAMAEVWLRMPVSRRALARAIGELPEEDLAKVRTTAAEAGRTSSPELPIDDPRRAFREDERARVYFAVAGTGEELELGLDADGIATSADAETPAFPIKRMPFRYRAADASAHAAADAGPYRELEIGRAHV